MKPAGAVFEDLFETLPENAIFVIFGVKNGQKKVRLRGWDLSGENRAGILRRILVPKSQMVPRRPIW